MCGIAGILSHNLASHRISALCESMITTLSHRGPDHQDVWANEGVGLAHSRLSILDLSESGHQPMSDQSGRWTIVFNGEVYNHGDLKRSLTDGGERLRGTSDTEILVEKIAEIGVSETVSQCRGMFAFAAYDNRERRLWLVRDRLGEKPLFFGIEEKTLWFGSELKVRSSWDCKLPDLDQRGIQQFFRLGYFPDPHTPFTGVYSLPPGTIVSFSLAEIDAATPSVNAVQKCFADGRYWNPADFVGGAASNDDSPPTTDLERLLESAVQEQLVADVEVGCFLSGGIDSSLVTALAAKLSGRQLRTFTIGFDEAEFDESQYAAQVAQALGTQHVTQRVSASDALEFAAGLGSTFDVPFANASALPSMILSRFAASEVKVCLTGDGADETFLGYNRYLYPPKLNLDAHDIRQRLLRATVGLTRFVPDSMVTRIVNSVLRLRGKKIQDAAGKLRKLRDTLGAPDSLSAYELLVSLLGKKELTALFGENYAFGPSVDRDLDYFDAVRLFDVYNYLPGDNLTKVDRTAMKFSLETRAPFLDHRVVETALGMREDSLVRDGSGKQPLKAILASYIPERLIHRPKMGFTVPIKRWLAHDLKPLVERAFDRSMLARQGVFSEGFVSNATPGMFGDGPGLWNFVVFQSWYSHVVHPRENAKSVSDFLSH